MATNVVESTVIDAPLDVLWPVIRTADFKYLNVVEEAHLVHGSAWCEVGSVRKLVYCDPQKSERLYSLDALDDLTHSLSYTLLEAKPPLPIKAAMHSIRCRRITSEPVKTFVQFASEYDGSVTAEMLEESRMHKRAFFHGLSRYAKKLMAEQHQHQGVGPLQSLGTGEAAKQTAAPLPAGKAQTAGQSQVDLKHTPGAAAGQAKGKACCGCVGACACKCCAGQPHTKGQGKACCGCTAPCNCACCAGASATAGKAQGAFKAPAQAQAQAQPPQRQHPLLARYGREIPIIAQPSGVGAAHPSAGAAPHPSGAAAHRGGAGAAPYHGGAGGRHAGAGTTGDAGAGVGGAGAGHPKPKLRPLPPFRARHAQPQALQHRSIPIGGAEGGAEGGAGGTGAAARAGGGGDISGGHHPGGGAASGAEDAKHAKKAKLEHPSASKAQTARELFESMDFQELHDTTKERIDEMWNSFDRDHDGTLSEEEVRDLIDALMDRMAEEDNEIVHSVAEMLREPSSPPSVASTTDFTEEFRGELKRTKPHVFKQLFGRLDRDHAGRIDKDEFRHHFADWFQKQVYQEARAAFFGTRGRDRD